MHPDVPRWARDVLEREVLDVPFKDFHVLKDGAMQKLAIGRTDTETFILQRTPAGSELYRVSGPPRGSNGNGHHALDSNPAPAFSSDVPEASCPACGTTFRYWRDDDRQDAVYCFKCGTAVATSPRRREEGERVARAG